MSATGERSSAIPIGVAITAVLAAIVVALVVTAGQPASGPVPVAWDRAACAHCAMHVSDPRFAVQLHTAQGRVLVFDDPGCLMLHLEEEELEVHAVYFRHHDEDRWLTAEQVGFVDAGPSPMGHGFGAVDRSTPGARSLGEVTRVVVQQKKAEAPR